MLKATPTHKSGAGTAAQDCGDTWATLFIKLNGQTSASNVIDAEGAPEDGGQARVRGKMRR